MRIILLLSVFYFKNMYAVSYFSKDSADNRYLHRHNCFFNVKVGYGFMFTQKPTALIGFSSKTMPEFEYFVLNNFSACIAVNYLHSSNTLGGGGGLIIERSAYIGIKKYFNLKKYFKMYQNHALSLNFGYHYGNDYIENYDSLRTTFDRYGGNFTAGIGYEIFPRKLFGCKNNNWGFCMEISHPINYSSEKFSFSYSGIGIKFLLNGKRRMRV